MDITDKFIHCKRLKHGDIFYTTDIYEGIRIGTQYKDYPAIIWKIFYKHKPWYLFWKKREIEGISVLWLGEEKIGRI